MYNPKDYNKKKAAVKLMGRIIAGLTIALVAVVTVAVLSIKETQRETRIASDYRQRLSVADGEIAYLRSVVNSLEEKHEGDE